MIIALARLTQRGTFLLGFAVGCSHAPARAPAQVSPAATARSTVLDDTVAKVLDRALADSAFPGAIAVVGNHDGILVERAVGHIDWSPSPAPDDHTLWDIASLTKVTGMTTAMMQLVEQGKIDLDAPVQRYIPDWTGPKKERVTVRHLLTHSSGLPAFKPYDKITTNADSIAKLMFATPLDTVPGARMVYSDIGAYMLGKLVERVSGETLDQYVVRHVFQPLGMNETRYNPPVEWIARIAPTEIDPLRGGKVRGKVHDERAYYLGGVSAHAGIFSSAHDLARFARMYLNGGMLDLVRIVKPETIALFTTLQDSALSNRALGWEKPTGRNSAGHLMSSRAFGHTGFTGTSIWIDPSRDLFVILLSNRVNPTRENNRIGGVRTALADAVVGTVDRLRSNTQPASR
jgi:CubicO group peptidase (beta-lactamase class C family)